MAYVDGFLIPVKIADRQKFIDHARRMDAIFVEFGARRIVEAWGDDLPDGTTTDFRKAVQAADGETVVFSWVEWPDKATRDAAGEKMRTDPRLRGEPMPFDGKRLIFGGFEPVVELRGVA